MGCGPADQGTEQLSWSAVRKGILSRDEGKCRRCLKPATDVHHRKPKQMGGTSSEATNYGAANLVSLCRACHTWIHAHPAESYDTGWLVHSWQDPADVPLKNPETYLF